MKGEQSPPGERGEGMITSTLTLVRVAALTLTG